MPKYRYQLANGKTLVLEGNEQPSDADAEEAAKSAGVELALAESSAGQSVPDTALMTAAPADEESIAPGMLASSGAAIRQAVKGVPAIMRSAGNLMRNGSGRITRAASAAIGASLGAGAGASIGGPVGAFGGAGIGADIGRTTARKQIIPATRQIGKALLALGETGFPESIYAGRPAIALGRKALGYGLAGVSGIGDALMAAEGLKLAYDRTKGIPDAIRKNPNMLAASPSYRTPEDEEMIRMLAERSLK